MLICFAENDAVIPKEIIDKLYDHTTGAQKRNLHLIRGSHHKTWEYFAENRSEQERMFNQVLKTLSFKEESS